MKINYHDDYLTFSRPTKNGEDAPSDSLSALFRDLLISGQLIDDGADYLLPYSVLYELPEDLRSELPLPPLYEHDLFVTKNENNQFTYEFQQNAGELGLGQVLGRAVDVQGAYINLSDSRLLTAPQYDFVTSAAAINASHDFNDRTQRKLATAKLLAAARRSEATILHSELTATEYVFVDDISLDVMPTTDGTYTLEPRIKGIEEDNLAELFNNRPRVMPNYRDRRRNREYIFEKGNEGAGAILMELQKVKGRTFTREELIDIAKDGSRKFDQEYIDLSLFSDRVVELGLYKPEYRQTIQQTKMGWLPGIKIVDPREGTSWLNIGDQSVLDELEAAIRKAGPQPQVEFPEGNMLPREVAIETAALANLAFTDNLPDHEEEEGFTLPSGQYVFVIKDNVEALDYLEEAASQTTPTEYHFSSIPNLARPFELRDHQRRGVGWLQTSYEVSQLPGVLLADDMGLGKTLQVLYFFEHFGRTQEAPVLIVAPTSLLENWANEYQRFFTHPNYGIYKVWGAEVKQYITKNAPGKSSRRMQQKGIYLTTYETLRNHQVHFGTVNWGVIALDEAQKVKTPGTMVTNAVKAMKSQFKIAMTGTPVENSLVDLWCIMDFCVPGLLRDAKWFRKTYERPISTEDDVTSEQKARELRDTINPSFLRRLKRDVLNDLPPIEHIYKRREMAPVQLRAYADVVERHQDTDNSKVRRNSLFNLKAIVDHPFLRTETIQEMDINHLIDTSAKLQLLIEVLDEVQNRQEKAIVFTESRAMQLIIRRLVKQLYDYTPDIINGLTPSVSTSAQLGRQAYIDEFQQRKGFGAIIMSPIAAGVGLNITGANHVIHYTRHWNPAKEQQATDRAHRIGQKKNVAVYYLLTTIPGSPGKSFDELLDDLLQRKKDLATATLFKSARLAVSEDDLVSTLFDN